MNIYEHLNNQLKKIVEGDVISLADYKKEKNNKKVLDQVDGMLSDAGSSMLEARVSYIKILECKTTDGFEPFKINEPIYDIKDVQAKFYALIQLAGMGKIEKPFMCKYQVSVIIGNGNYKDFHKESIGVSEYTATANLATGTDASVIAMAVDALVEDEFDKPVRVRDFGGAMITPSQKEVNNAVDTLRIEINKNLKGNTEQQGTELTAKGYGKSPEDVEVGDILHGSWGYGMTTNDFYRVVSRTKSSVKLEKLATKKKADNDDTGVEVPLDVVVKDNNVDGKNFRIIPTSRQAFSNVESQSVCKVDSARLSYWDGNPKHYSTFD